MEGGSNTLGREIGPNWEAEAGDSVAGDGDLLGHEETKPENKTTAAWVTGTG